MKVRTASVLLLAWLTAVPAFAGIFRPAPKNGVPDVYIVVLEEGVAGKPGPRPGLPPVADVAQSLARKYQGAVTEVWDAALHGFVIRMPEARARQLAGDPRVLSVEQNLFISAPVGDCYSGTAWQDTRPLPSSTTSPQTISCSDADPLNDSGAGAPVCRDNWGIDRIDQPGLPRDNNYYFPNGGTNVHVYVLDTGIRWSHREFLNANGTSRVSGGVDARTNPVTPGNATNTDDCYGHGTHVASIVAGRTYGVAKNASLHPVRTVGCPNDPLSNEQFIDNTIRGMNWIVNEVVTRRATQLWPALVNWSGGNDTVYAGSVALRTAVRNVVDNNIVLVQAAGNQSPDYQLDPSVLRDACQWSFGGSVPKVIVAGGTDYNDGRWTRRPTRDSDDRRYCASGDCGSNVGTCVDLWAPAAHVIGSNRGGDDLACRLSGTSMAAPHVAGAAAIYLSENPSAIPEEVDRALRSRGAWGFLQSSEYDRNYIGRDSDNVIVSSNTTSIGDTAPVAAFSVQCPGRQCVFDAIASTDDAGIYQYAWRIGDLAMAAGQVVRYDFPANHTGEVILRVTDTTGKTDHLLQTVSVNADAPPTALFTLSCQATTCTFDSGNSNDDQSIAYRKWEFGDNRNASGEVVTHTYSAGGSYRVTLTITDNVGQIDVEQQTASVTGLSAPTGVVATANGGTVTIQWNAVSGADGYNVERKVSSAAWHLAQNVNGGTQLSVTDVPATPNGVVLYRVIARAGAATSASSSHDVAYAAAFLDDPVVTPTGIKAEHITELRRAVNTLRDIAGQSPAYSAAALDSEALREEPIDDADFTGLMQELNTARSFAGLPVIGFGTTPAATGVIDRTQIVNLRNGLK